MLLRDRLLARIHEMGDRPDYSRLASEILGIRNAPPDLARRLVSQALVVEDRAEKWRAIGERICRDAPQTPGVYILRDDNDRVLYVGKAVNVRRRLRAHFSPRRWKALPAEFARASQAEIRPVGSELEALLLEASLIDEWRPRVNTQIGPPALDSRSLPAAIVRDVLVLQPSIDDDSAELIGARVSGDWVIRRARRDGADIMAVASTLTRFFSSPRRRKKPALAPLVYSWLAQRGESATRLDPHALNSPAALEASLASLLKDRSLFSERIIYLPR